jgi:hypothetical protein
MPQRREGGEKERVNQEKEKEKKERRHAIEISLCVRYLVDDVCALLR